MRVDHNFGKDDSLFARYTIEDAIDFVPGPGFGASVYGFKEFQNSEPSRSQFITLSESHIFSPVLLWAGCFVRKWAAHRFGGHRI